jgi:hypothetical protein
MQLDCVVPHAPCLLALQCRCSPCLPHPACLPVLSLAPPALPTTAVDGGPLMPLGGPGIGGPGSGGSSSSRAALLQAKRSTLRKASRAIQALAGMVGASGKIYQHLIDLCKVCARRLHASGPTQNQGLAAETQLSRCQSAATTQCTYSTNLFACVWLCPSALAAAGPAACST